MRLIFIFLSIIISQSYGQDNPLFKIISYSEGVLLDGIPVKPGQVVYSNSIWLEVPKKGFVGVITIDGYSHELKRRIKVKSINREAKDSNHESKPFWYGAAIPSIPRFSIIGVPSNQISQIAGDSVFFGFKVNYEMDPPFTAKFLDMFDKILLLNTLESNWGVFNINTLIENEPAILFELSSNTYTSEKILLKKINPELLSKVKLEIAKIQNDLIARLALYELNHLNHDHLFLLYKIETTKNLNLDPISSIYLAKRREKYQLDRYNLK